MLVRKMTPVLVVDRIEPSIELWVDRLGFEKTLEVPEGGHLGFAAFAWEGLEIMYQTRESVETEVRTADLPRALLPDDGLWCRRALAARAGRAHHRVRGVPRPLKTPAPRSAIP
jgi:hypothetical protein